MSNSSKNFALILILIIVLSGLRLLMVKPTNAQSIPTPSVPEFTLNFDQHSSDKPAVFTTDPYTGKQQELEPAKHYEWETINITIKNQPFTPYQIKDGNNIWNLTIYYSVRNKGHFSNIWGSGFTPDYYQVQSSGQYTEITFFVGPNGPRGDIMQGENVLEPVPSAGGQVDFQVEALIGYMQSEGVSVTQMFGVQLDWVFNGTESGWSNTQTISIPASSVSPSPTPVVPELSLLVIVPLVLSIFSVAVIVRHRKPASKPKA